MSSVRDGLQDVIDDLLPTIAHDHDGYLMPVEMVRALVALLANLIDQDNDEMCYMDLETWPVAAALVEAHRAGMNS